VSPATPVELGGTMGFGDAAVAITFLCCATATIMFWIDSRAKNVKKRTLPIDPEQILAERFAHGELDEIEYAQRLSILRVGPPLHTYIDR
jgi:uncharacterized membrane protein